MKFVWSIPLALALSVCSLGVAAAQPPPAPIFDHRKLIAGNLAKLFSADAHVRNAECSGNSAPVDEPRQIGHLHAVIEHRAGHAETGARDRHRRALMRLPFKQERPQHAVEIRMLSANVAPAECQAPAPLPQRADLQQGLGGANITDNDHIGLLPSTRRF
jgi:hypothetical protein